MNWILDGALVAIALVFGFMAYRKGFISTLLELIGFLLSLFLAAKLSTLCAGWIYDTFFETKIIENMVEKLTASASLAGESVMAALPKVVTTASAGLGLNLQAAVSSGVAAGTIEDAALSLNESVVEPAVVMLIRAIAFLVIFLLISALIKVLIKLFKKVNKLPLLGKINKGFGFVLGFAKGVVIAVVVAFVLGSLVSLFGSVVGIDEALLNQTVLMKWILQFNPIFG